MLQCQPSHLAACLPSSLALVSLPACRQWCCAPCFLTPASLLALRVTQLLERLNEVVEESNLFDPDHPGLEEELESLHRRLESLSSSEPSSMETHFSSQAGRCRLQVQSPHLS